MPILSMIVNTSSAIYTSSMYAAVGLVLDVMGHLDGSRVVEQLGISPSGGAICNRNVGLSIDFR